MLNRHMLISALIVIVCNFSIITYARELDHERKALGLISDFADKYCKEAPTTGMQRTVEIEGEAKASLSSLISKITDLGIKGAGKYKKSEYNGPLQQDLVHAMSDTNNCRIQVLNVLGEKLLGKKTAQKKVVNKKRPEKNGKLKAQDQNRQTGEVSKLEESLNNDIDFFVKNLAYVDLNIECRNDPEYMKKYNQAKALLDTIEAKAKKTGNKEILDTFVWPRRHGIHISKDDCGN